MLRVAMLQAQKSAFILLSSAFIFLSRHEEIILTLNKAVVMKGENTLKSNVAYLTLHGVPSMLSSSLHATYKFFERVAIESVEHWKWRNSWDLLMCRYKSCGKEAVSDGVPIPLIPLTAFPKYVIDIISSLASNFRILQLEWKEKGGQEMWSSRLIRDVMIRIVSWSLV